MLYMRLLSWLLVLGSLLSLPSCATIFNTSEMPITIATSAPSLIVHNNDTTNAVASMQSITVNRRKEPLLFTAISDSITKTIIIPAKNSTMYWMNFGLLTYSFVGFLIDCKSRLRYGYPNSVYVNMNDSDGSYLPYIPLTGEEAKRSNMLKISPLKLIGTVHPSFELAYERKTSARFSTQLMASYLLDGFSNADSKLEDNNTRGYRVALEERYYFKMPAPRGVYLAAELDFMNKRYNDILTFSNQPSDGFLFDKNSYQDSVAVHKQNVSFNIKIGQQIMLERLSFDFYVGLGLRYKSTRHSNRLNPDDFLDSPSPLLFNFSYLQHEEIKSLTLSLPFNIRIGYWF